MTIAEIKQAVDEGKFVYWVHSGYKVIKDNAGQYLIQCTMNDHCIGLTNRAGTHLNGEEDEFKIIE